MSHLVSQRTNKSTLVYIPTANTPPTPEHPTTVLREPVEPAEPAPAYPGWRHVILNAHAHCAMKIATFLASVVLCPHFLNTLSYPVACKVCLLTFSRR
jgi:hypothetical protein